MCGGRYESILPCCHGDPTPRARKFPTFGARACVPAAAAHKEVVAVAVVAVKRTNRKSPQTGKGRRVVVGRHTPTKSDY